MSDTIWKRARDYMGVWRGEAQVPPAWQAKAIQAVHAALDAGEAAEKALAECTRERDEAREVADALDGELLSLLGHLGSAKYERDAALEERDDQRWRAKMAEAREAKLREALRKIASGMPKPLGPGMVALARHHELSEIARAALAEPKDFFSEAMKDPEVRQHTEREHSKDAQALRDEPKEPGEPDPCEGCGNAGSRAYDFKDHLCARACTVLAEMKGETHGA